MKHIAANVSKLSLTLDTLASQAASDTPNIRVYGPKEDTEGNSPANGETSTAIENETDVHNISTTSYEFDDITDIQDLNA